MGFASRLPTGNEPPHERGNRWLSTNELVDETALLLWGKARRCVTCRRATDLKHLNALGHCPDCLAATGPGPGREG